MFIIFILYFFWFMVIFVKLINGLLIIFGFRYNFRFENILGLSIFFWIFGGILFGFSRLKLEVIILKLDFVLGSLIFDLVFKEWMYVR